MSTLTILAQPKFWRFQHEWECAVSNASLLLTAEVLKNWASVDEALKRSGFDNTLFLKLVEALGEEQMPRPSGCCRTRGVRCSADLSVTRGPTTEQSSYQPHAQLVDGEVRHASRRFRKAFNAANAG